MKAIHEFLDTEVSFETLLNPFLKLIFKLKMKQDNLRTADPLDIFVYFLKRALDRQQPLINHD